MVHHDGAGIFSGVPSPFRTARYHSLVIDPNSVGQGWTVSAWTDEVDADGRSHRVIMGLRREWETPGKAPLEGVQFHPESFMTEHGADLLRNFLSMPAPALLP